ncbi:MAG: Rpn family recombination-promoting nuclease/putative transposase [Oscillochloridaceae bacterium umkhey_bin13]
MMQPLDFDTPWKDILDAYLPEFFALFFPDVHQDIDWAQPVVPLDKELQQVVRDAHLGRRLADKLVQVARRDGQEAWVLIHIEVQAHEEADFAQRMFRYYYRLLDRYNRQIMSVAVLGDERATWRPTTFQRELWGCAAHFQFPVIKLLDYQSQQAALAANPNPFATVVLAHLAAQQTRRNLPQRAQIKFQLVRQLYERGFQRADIIQLFHFIDWLLELPPALSASFWSELTAWEEEQRMPYITSVEQMGIEKGLAQGIEKGRVHERRDLVLHLLTRRVGAVSADLHAQIAALTPEQLLALSEALFDLTSVDAVQQWLAHNAA